MTSWKRRALAILVGHAGALTLAALAATERETPFTASELATWENFGTALDDGTNLLILNARASAVLRASDPRVAGTAKVSCSGVLRTNKVGLLWGSFRLVSIGGTWEGYWQGTNYLENSHVVTSRAMTAEGTGVYEGLVLRAIGTAFESGPLQWSGWVVNDRQARRPYQLKGLRVDRGVTITGTLLDPLTMRSTGTRGSLV